MWLKDLTNKHQDAIQINKGWLWQMFDSEQCEDADDNNYEFLASNEQFNAIETDFNDPASLRRRQKMILEAISAHKEQKFQNFEPLKILKKTEIKLWVLILCHGGKFVIQVYENTKCVFTRSDSKYVIRKKSGGRQLNCDRSKKIMSSVGSQMRRENERLLQDHIEGFMDEAAEYIKQADVIFLHAPGLNKQLFLAESAPLAEQHHKIKSILFGNKKASYTEAVELVKKLTEVKIVLEK